MPAALPTVNAWEACAYFCRPFPVRVLMMDSAGHLGCDCAIPVKQLQPEHTDPLRG